MLKRWVLVITMLFSLFTLATSTASAETLTFSGTISSSDPTMAVVFITTPNCTGLGATPVHYKVISVPPLEGFSTFTLSSSPTFASMYLYVNSFNPATPMVNCIAAVNSGSPKVLTYGLKESSSYYIVVIDDTFAQSGGSFQLTISKADAPLFTDGRCNLDADQPLTVYADGDGGYKFYAVNNGIGYYAMQVKKSELDANPTTGTNILIRQAKGVRLYRLADGTLQVNRVKPDGSEYAFVLTGCS